MAVEVILPKVDMDMESGTIEAWRVAEGDSVRQGQLIFEIGTSKALMEVEAPATGIIRGIKAKIGDTVPVGAAVAWIYGPAEPWDDATAADQSVELRAPPNAGPVGLPGGIPRAGDVMSLSALAVRATPLARRMARQLGIELSHLAGTGPRGRISGNDVLALGENGILTGSKTPDQTSLNRRASASMPQDRMSAGTDGSELRPFSSAQKIAARRLTLSATTVPHFFVNAMIDMSAALELLKRLGAAMQAKHQVKPSLTAFLAHAVGRILADHPLLNASAEGDAARIHQARNIGIAMDRGGDLIVPVIRNAGAGALIDTMLSFDRVRRAALERSLAPADMEGGTFTISNLGMFGVDSFTAIINPPQSAILAVGRTVETPAGADGQIVLRPLANFCLSADHRLVNGVTAARFMADLRNVVEHPELFL